MKYVLAFPAVILLIAVFYTTAYYFSEIRPSLDRVEEKIERYQNFSPNKELMADIAIEQEGSYGVFRYAAHIQALENIDHGFRSIWHLMGLHWHLWLKVLYSDSEVFQLWLAQLPYSEGRGAKEAAMFYFERKFEELSCYQIVQLTAAARAPKALEPGSERSERWIRDHGTAAFCSS